MEISFGHAADQETCRKEMLQGFEIFMPVTAFEDFAFIAAVILVSPKMEVLEELKAPAGGKEGSFSTGQRGI